MSTRFYTTEEMEALKTKFFKDPEWHLVRNLFMSYADQLVDLDTIDVSDTNESVKGEIRARKHMHSIIKTFFTEAENLANGVVAPVQDPRDSTE